jgi:hypothetical protein
MNQNTELLQLLEAEENKKLCLAQGTEGALRELEVLKSKYDSLMTTAKAHEDMCASVSKENHFRTEEVHIMCVCVRVCVYVCMCMYEWRRALTTHISHPTHMHTYAHIINRFGCCGKSWPTLRPAIRSSR